MLRGIYTILYLTMFTTLLSYICITYHMNNLLLLYYTILVLKQYYRTGSGGGAPTCQPAPPARTSSYTPYGTVIDKILPSTTPLTD